MTTHRYSCMIGDDFHDVDAASAYQAVQLVARKVGQASARHAETFEEDAGIDSASMRAFITDQGEIINVVKLHPDWEVGMGAVDIPLPECLPSPDDDVNRLTVPEVSGYSRQEIEGGVIVRYMMRQPGERDWHPVRLVRLT